MRRNLSKKTNPGVEGRGLQNLLKHISVFQKRFPGHRFRVNWFRQRHGQMLVEWTQLGEDGRELITAHSYGRLNEFSVVAHLAVAGALTRYNVPQHAVLMNNRDANK